MREMANCRTGPTTGGSTPNCRWRGTFRENNRSQHRDRAGQRVDFDGARGLRQGHEIVRTVLIQMSATTRSEVEQVRASAQSGSS